MTGGRRLGVGPLWKKVACIGKTHALSQGMVSEILLIKPLKL